MTDPDSTDIPSNWGRWGADDELGTLNLITDEVRARAVALARTGRCVSLAIPIDPASMMGGPFAPPTPPSPPVQQAMLYTGTPPMAMAEVLVVTPHNPGLTHLDALVHIPVDGHVYPGRPLAEAVTGRPRRSPTVCSPGGSCSTWRPVAVCRRPTRSPAPTSTPRSSAAACAWSPGTRWWSAAGGPSPGTRHVPCRA